MRLHPRSLLILNAILRTIRALITAAFVGVSQAANSYLLDRNLEASANLGLAILLVTFLTVFFVISSRLCWHPLNIYILILEIIISGTVISAWVLCTISISPAFQMSRLILLFQLPYILVCVGTGLSFTVVVLSIGILVVSFLSIIFTRKSKAENEISAPQKDTVAEDTDLTTFRSNQNGGTNTRAGVICCNMNCCQNGVISISSYAPATVSNQSSSEFTESEVTDLSSSRANVLSTNSDGLFFSFRNSVRDSLLVRLSTARCTVSTAESPVLPKRGAVRTPASDVNGSRELAANSSRYL